MKVTSGYEGLTNFECRQKAIHDNYLSKIVRVVRISDPVPTGVSHCPIPEYGIRLILMPPLKLVHGGVYMNGEGTLIRIRKASYDAWFVGFSTNNGVYMGRYREDGTSVEGLPIQNLMYP